MSAFVHTRTPGPWIAHKVPSIAGGFGFVIQAGMSRGITIATLFPGSSTDRIERIACANAALIAAAPDLHRLAIAARDYLSGIPETAAAGDDAAVALASQIDRLIASIEVAALVDAAAAPAKVTP